MRSSAAEGQNGAHRAAVGNIAFAMMADLVVCRVVAGPLDQGIVIVTPFSCMPGTITSGLLKRVREDFGNIPLLNIAYEGQQDTQTVTRLEAFVHQARAYQEAQRAEKNLPRKAGSHFASSGPRAGKRSTLH